MLLALKQIFLDTINIIFNIFRYLYLIYAKKRFLNSKTKKVGKQFISNIFNKFNYSEENPFLGFCNCLQCMSNYSLYIKEDGFV